MGRVVHFEIHAENPQRAIAFYQGLFGWEITKWDGPMDYWMIRTGPKEQMGIDGGWFALPRHDRRYGGHCLTSRSIGGGSDAAMKVRESRRYARPASDKDPRRRLVGLCHGYRRQIRLMQPDALARVFSRLRLSE